MKLAHVLRPLLVRDALPLSDEIRVVVAPDEDGVFVADVPLCLAVSFKGAARDEAMDNSAIRTRTCLERITEERRTIIHGQCESHVFLEGRSESCARKMVGSAVPAGRRAHRTPPQTQIIFRKKNSTKKNRFTSPSPQTTPASAE